MKYRNVVKAKFIERPNRFVAKVLVENGSDIVSAHVKNTGRCRELLVPGATVYLEDFDGRMGSRKMRYSLIAAEKEIAPAKRNGDMGSRRSQTAEGESGKLLVNMDSQAPNRVVQEALASGKLQLPGLSDAPGPLRIKPEKTYGNSRFDFYIETGCGDATGAVLDNGRRKALIEVKGVTLEADGVAKFPDAPTARGVKHIEELCRANEDGFLAYILFVIQMKNVRTFEPNDETHPEFGEALARALTAGVQAFAYDCRVEPDSLALDSPVKINIAGS